MRTFPSMIVPVVMLLASCATTQRTDLFFGMNIPGGGSVSTEEWKIFNDSVVSPQFPEGYTEFEAAGKWFDSDTRGTISENTRVLSFIGKKDRRREAGLDSVSHVYIRQFSQQAVLRVDSRVRFRLITGR